MTLDSATLTPKVLTKFLTLNLDLFTVQTSLPTTIVDTGHFVLRVLKMFILYKSNCTKVIYKRSKGHQRPILNSLPHLHRRKFYSRCRYFRLKHSIWGKKNKIWHLIHQLNQITLFQSKCNRWKHWPGMHIQGQIVLCVTFGRWSSWTSARFLAPDIKGLPGPSVSPFRPKSSDFAAFYKLNSEVKWPWVNEREVFCKERGPVWLFSK